MKRSRSWRGRARALGAPFALLASIGSAGPLAAQLPPPGDDDSASPASARTSPASPTPIGADRLVEAVLSGSPALEAHRRVLAAARARLEGAGAAPPLVLSGEMEDVPRGVDVSGAAFRLEVGRELVGGGRGAAARALAQAELVRARAEMDGAALELEASTRATLARLLGAAWTARRLAAEDTLLQATEAPLRARFATGGSPYVDVLRISTERLRVGNDRTVATAELSAARAALQGLAGEGASEVAAILDQLLAGPVPAAETEAPEPLPDLAGLLDRSPALEAAGARVEIARAALELAEAEGRPRLGFSVGAQRLGGEGGFGPVVGASVSLPFTARTALASERAAAGEELAAAEAALRATRDAVAASLAAAAARYQAARERLRVHDAALLLGARQERETALAAFRGGQLTLLELMDFERALARAEIERVRARTDAMVARAELLSASAGPSLTTLSEVSP